MRSFFLFAFCFFILGCQPDLSPFTASIESIKTNFAPDKRVAIWEVEALPGDPIILRGKTNLPEAKKALLQSLESQSLSYTDSLEVLIPKPGIVSVSVCNIRSNPMHSAELATQSTMGQLLQIYEEQDGWFRVQTPDQYLGWLDPGGFHAFTEAEVPLWNEADQRQLVYLQEYGFAYSAPDLNAQPVSDLIKGNIFLLVDTKDAFSQIQLPDGKMGYVPTETTRPFSEWWEQQNSQQSSEAILSEAVKLLGRPYLWGGTSGKGMDCSGFTKEVYYRNGTILPRDASQQVQVGVRVETDTTSWSNLKAGDLLFFGRKATPEKNERITHVAIYMGNGRIIHSSGEVKIESLLLGEPDYAPERVASFVRAKRLL